MLLEHFHFSKALFPKLSFDEDFEIKGSGGDYESTTQCGVNNAPYVNTCTKH